MNKSTLMLIIGAAIAFFGYRYFLKGKPSGSVKTNIPVTQKTGSMILPGEQTEPLYKSDSTFTVEKSKVGIPVVCVYKGSDKNFGGALPLSSGDNITAILRADGEYDILKILSKNDYIPYTLVVNKSFITLS